MMHKTPLLIVLVVLLLALTPLTAGCLSIPGPEDGKKTPVVTPVTTTAAPERTNAIQTPLTRRAFTPVTTPVPATSAGSTGGAVTATCTQQGGTAMQAGYRCTGTWLAASDTFSCCSTVPVRETAATGNATGTLIPPTFSLSVNLDDNLGSITP